MLACDQTITIVSLSNHNTFTTTVISGCSWFSKSVGAMTDRGLQGSREIHCRIPAASAPETLPAVGDYLVLGAQEGISSLQQLKGLDFGRITSVADNRREWAPLQHIGVVAQ